LNYWHILGVTSVVPILHGDPLLKEKFALYEEAYLPVHVLGELYYGAFNSSKKTSNLEKSANQIVARKVI